MNTSYARYLNDLPVIYLAPATLPLATETTEVVTAFINPGVGPGQAAEAAANLGPGCTGVFNDPNHNIGTATYYQALSFNAGTAGYFDAFGVAGSLTLSQTGYVDPVTGRPWAGDPTVQQYFPSDAIAVTAGGVTIYLGEEFYNESAAAQEITLVHELLHLTQGRRVR
jgi:hypothetical protein